MRQLNTELKKEIIDGVDEENQDDALDEFFNDLSYDFDLREENYTRSLSQIAKERSTHHHQINNRREFRRLKERHYEELLIKYQEQKISIMNQLKERMKLLDSAAAGNWRENKKASPIPLNMWD